MVPAESPQAMMPPSVLDAAQRTASPLRISSHLHNFSQIKQPKEQRTEKKMLQSLAQCFSQSFSLPDKQWSESAKKRRNNSTCDRLTGRLADPPTDFLESEIRIYRDALVSASADNVPSARRE